MPSACAPLCEKDFLLQNSSPSGLWRLAGIHLGPNFKAKVWNSLAHGKSRWAVGLGLYNCPLWSQTSTGLRVASGNGHRRHPHCKSLMVRPHPPRHCVDRWPQCGGSGTLQLGRVPESHSVAFLWLLYLPAPRQQAKFTPKTRHKAFSAAPHTTLILA